MKRKSEYYPTYDHFITGNQEEAMIRLYYSIKVAVRDMVVNMPTVEGCPAE
ncbi:MAG: hypothetical protein LUE16_09175 [Lachnospiraceae bacterium]|nr:hypothetical protein [Lachnospiraceae bacterium]